MNFVIHDKAGRVIRTGFCPDGMEHVQAQEGEGMVCGTADSAQHYVHDGAVAERPPSPARLDGLVLSNMPTWSKVTINGKTYAVEDSSISLEFTHVGTYKIVVEAFPFRDAVFEVTKE